MYLHTLCFNHIKNENEFEQCFNTKTISQNYVIALKNFGVKASIMWQHFYSPMWNGMQTLPKKMIKLLINQLKS